MKTLIVGGHHDGERVNVGDGRRWLRMEVDPLIPVPEYNREIMEIPSVDFTLDGYSIREFRSSSGDVKLYAHPSLSDKRVMQRLIKGYNPVTANEDAG